MRGTEVGTPHRWGLLVIILVLDVGWVLELFPPHELWRLRGLGLVQSPEGPEGAEQPVAHARQGAVVALREPVVHLMVVRVCRVRQRQMDAGVEGEVVGDVQDRPSEERDPSGTCMEPCQPRADVATGQENGEAVDLLEGVLVRRVLVAPERNELSVVLLVAERVEGTLVGDAVDGVVDDIVQDHREHERNRPVRQRELLQPRQDWALEQERDDVVHAYEFNQRVETQVAIVDGLELLEFLHLAFTFVDPLQLEQVCEEDQRRVQSFLRGDRHHIEQRIRGEAQVARRVPGLRTGGHHENHENADGGDREERSSGINARQRRVL
mmetsp:Transcript_47307/g.134629  ORF Transcript_47307/g.134629 Transcript_47307/m.134629 type:complete len:324 (-) Transcript_47307:73-1044(-)